MNSWVILTMEYPPALGGVAGYTWQLAHKLAEQGDEVHVFAPDFPSVTKTANQVHVHALPGRFDAASRRNIQRELTRLERETGPGRVILLVQYVAHGFGCRGMNVFFAWWLRQASRRLWIMFHEVAYPFLWGQPLKHHLLAGVQHFMAGLVARKAEMLWVSVPGWEDRLRWICRLRNPIRWLPIPSNLPIDVPAAAVAQAKRAWPWPPGTLTVGYFGHYSPPFVPALTAVLSKLLEDEPAVTAVLLGKGSDVYAGRFGEMFPTLAGRVLGQGTLSAEAAAAELSAVDLAIYPFLDGVSSRRTSLMAALALGLPIVTTSEYLTEPVWQERGAVQMVPVGDWHQFVAAVRRLLADPAARARLGEQGRQLYRDLFDIEHIVASLRSAVDWKSGFPASQDSGVSGGKT
jgi:glycosyltransferase involved in cell wall biosynthesis